MQNFVLALAVSVPTLLAYRNGMVGGLPSQFLSMGCWAVFMLFARRAQDLKATAWSALVALALLQCGAVRAAWSGTPDLALAPMLVLLAATALIVVGAQGRPRELLTGMSTGLLLAGGMGALIGIVQVFFPSLTDGRWLAASAVPGRATGNVQQADHLAIWLSLASIGLIWLSQSRAWPTWLTVAAQFLLIVALVLSGSRSGMLIGLPLLMGWALLDRQLDQRLRRLLFLSPVMAAVAWLSMYFWADFTLAAVGQVGASTGLKLLGDAWELSWTNPWAGIGWGAFQRAWMLTPSADRLPSIPTHTGNLPLQLWVELGWLHGSAIVIALALSLWGCVRLVRRERLKESPRRFAFAMLALLGLHSMLDHPLLHPYFLLPCALILGIALAAETGSDGATKPWPAQFPRLLGVLVLGAVAWAAYEYERVSKLFGPTEDSRPYSLRVDEVIRSPLYGHHADYAAAVLLPPSEQMLAAAQRASRHSIDTRLLIAWARTLHHLGRGDEARYLANRVRELRSPEGEHWFAECTSSPTAWQCQLAQGTYQWRDF